MKSSSNEIPSAKGRATSLSQLIAETLSQLRLNLGQTQREFADIMGVSFQQYQKYEKGKDRLSLEKAMTLSRHYNFPLDMFFHPGDENQQHQGVGFAETAQTPFGTQDPAQQQELMQLYARMDVKAKKHLLETARFLATSSGKN